MKAKIIVALIIVMAVFTGCGSSSESKRQTDVRNACWGDSIEKVKKNETAIELLHSKNQLYYIADFCGSDVTLEYEFDDRYGLYKVSYFFEDGSSYYMYQKYKDIVSILKSHYGTPEHDEHDWVIESLKEKINNYSIETKLSKGITSITDEWKYDNKTEVYLRISQSSNGKICIYCVFSSKEYNQTTT